MDSPNPLAPAVITCSHLENKSLPFFRFKNCFCIWFCLTSVASPAPRPAASQKHGAQLLWGRAAALGMGSSIPSLVLVQLYH